tara:strand:+ start:63 stop:317 length:255 start_codon:yes stop_codon:yes gene_type:complete
MRNLILIVTLFCLNFNTYSFSNEVNCDQFKKLSISYMTCKANLIKNNTISVGKNFVEDTKDYQKNEWTEEKNKLNDLKEKVLEK